MLTETNTAFGAPGSVPTPIAPGATLAFMPALQHPVCSDALENNEPDTASVNCFCQANLNPDDKVSASDSADLTCQSSPDLPLTKVCADPAADGTNAVTITATATNADLNFESCTVTGQHQPRPIRRAPRMSARERRHGNAQPPSAGGGRRASRHRLGRSVGEQCVQHRRDQLHGRNDGRSRDGNGRRRLPGTG